MSSRKPYKSCRICPSDSNKSQTTNNASASSGTRVTATAQLSSTSRFTEASASKASVTKIRTAGSGHGAQTSKVIISGMGLKPGSLKVTSEIPYTTSGRSPRRSRQSRSTSVYPKEDRISTTSPNQNFNIQESIAIQEGQFTADNNNYDIITTEEEVNMQEYPEIDLPRAPPEQKAWYEEDEFNISPLKSDDDDYGLDDTDANMTPLEIDIDFNFDLYGGIDLNEEADYSNLSPLSPGDDYDLSISPVASPCDDDCPNSPMSAGLFSPDRSPPISSESPISDTSLQSSPRVIPEAAPPSPSDIRASGLRQPGTGLRSSGTPSPGSRAPSYAQPTPEGDELCGRSSTRSSISPPQAPRIPIPSSRALLPQRLSIPQTQSELDVEDTLVRPSSRPAASQSSRGTSPETREQQRSISSGIPSTGAGSRPSTGMQAPSGLRRPSGIKPPSSSLRPSQDSTSRNSCPVTCPSNRRKSRPSSDIPEAKTSEDRPKQRSSHKSTDTEPSSPRSSKSRKSPTQSPRTTIELEPMEQSISSKISPRTSAEVPVLISEPVTPRTSTTRKSKDLAVSNSVITEPEIIENQEERDVPPPQIDSPVGQIDARTSLKMSRQIVSSSRGTVIDHSLLGMKTIEPGKAKQIEMSKKELIPPSRLKLPSNTTLGTSKCVKSCTAKRQGPSSRIAPPRTQYTAAVAPVIEDVGEEVLPPEVSLDRPSISSPRMSGPQAPSAQSIPVPRQVPPRSGLRAPSGMRPPMAGRGSSLQPPLASRRESGMKPPSQAATNNLPEPRNIPVGQYYIPAKPGVIANSPEQLKQKLTKNRPISLANWKNEMQNYNQVFNAPLQEQHSDVVATNIVHQGRARPEELAEIERRRTSDILEETLDPNLPEEYWTSSLKQAMEISEEADSPESYPECDIECTSKSGRPQYSPERLPQSPQGRLPTPPQAPSPQARRSSTPPQVAPPQARRSATPPQVAPPQARRSATPPQVAPPQARRLTPPRQVAPPQTVDDDLYDMNDPAYYPPMSLYDDARPSPFNEDDMACNLGVCESYPATPSDSAQLIEPSYASRAPSPQPKPSSPDGESFFSPAQPRQIIQGQITRAQKLQIRQVAQPQPQYGVRSQMSPSRKPSPQQRMPAPSVTAPSRPSRIQAPSRPAICGVTCPSTQQGRRSLTPSPVSPPQSRRSPTPPRPPSPEPPANAWFEVNAIIIPPPQSDYDDMSDLSDAADKSSMKYSYDFGELPEEGTPISYPSYTSSMSPCDDICPGSPGPSYRLPLSSPAETPPSQRSSRSPISQHNQRLSTTPQSLQTPSQRLQAPPSQRRPTSPSQRRPTPPAQRPPTPSIVPPAAQQIRQPKRSLQQRRPVLAIEEAPPDQRYVPPSPTFMPCSGAVDANSPERLKERLSRYTPMSLSNWKNVPQPQAQYPERQEALRNAYPDVQSANIRTRMGAPTAEELSDIHRRMKPTLLDQTIDPYATDEEQYRAAEECYAEPPIESLYERQDQEPSRAQSERFRRATPDAYADRPCSAPAAPAMTQPDDEGPEVYNEDEPSKSILDEALLSKSITSHPYSPKSSPTPINLEISIEVPTSSVGADANIVKKLIDEERNDALVCKILMSPFKDKLDKLKKKPQAVKLLEETMNQSIPGDDEGDSFKSDIMASIMATEEKGKIDTTKSPKRTYETLFPALTDEPVLDVAPAGPAPLQDIVVPVGEAEVEDAELVNEDIRTTFASEDAISDMPPCDLYAESMARMKDDTEERKKSETEEKAKEKERIEKRRKSSLKALSTPRDESYIPSGELEEEKAPWEIDLDDLEELVGGQMSTMEENLPSDESIRATKGRLEYILEYEKPMHYSCVQLQGSQPPDWFPGYYSVFPQTPNYVQLEKSPSRVMQVAWNVFAPTDILDNSEIIIT